ncbi:MAG: carboxylating nicotinate-nucleotide diphosphorylase [Schleiferiaceae bacterium]|jgi:nicotinate-nucleotide pyrophosphorylase (carboxylating)|nr:carboxylating nicotinate-nucleotide diphosphorylase [Schleiferiaceae bacterium]
MLHEFPFLDQWLDIALKEDLGDGDHSSLSSIPADATGKVKCLFKADGVVAGIELAKIIFAKVDPSITMDVLEQDGSYVKNGTIVFYAEGPRISLLSAERLMLNCMQRLSAVATTTHIYAQTIAHTSTKVLDTRKTTPGLRHLEKWAVKLGGGENHRVGLYDMIMLKDNHIDFAGGIEKAIHKTKEYLKEKGKDLRIEVETRDLNEVKEVMRVGGIDRIMLDNFTPAQTKEAVALIDGKYETESSGGITLDTLASYAECGVDYISVGALTHSSGSLDISLKAV